MKISVVTSTLNVKNQIQLTIESIKSQSCTNFQWIVIDGASVDGTVCVLKENKNVIDCLISEVDTGIYEAWNKGLSFVNGDWVLFLGAGDTFYSDETIGKMYELLNKINKNIDFVCCDILYEENKILKKISGNFSFGKWDLGLPCLPPHPGVLHNANLFKKLNHKFDQKYSIAADAKFMLEHFKPHNYQYVNTVVTKMISGGVSSSPSSWGKIQKEKLSIRQELKLSPPNIFFKIRDLKLIIKPFLFRLFGQKIKKLTNFIKFFQN